MIHPFHKKLAAVLDRMGNLYTPQDILNAIAIGKMQSFTDGDSWAVTQIAITPRTEMLEIVFTLGNLSECRILHDRILQYARDHDIGLVQSYGRRGWNGEARRHGWKVRTTSYLYQREL